MKISNTNGFGLLEVIISISVIILVVGGTVTLGNSALRNNTISQERTVAYNLAREGVEVVRQIRDTKWINGTPDSWADFGITGSQDVQNVGDAWVFGSSLPHKIEDIDYSRVITIDKYTLVGENTDETARKVTVKVTWRDYGRDFNVELNEILTNWNREY
jgi:type II secretory pathway pseudopilin PulG